MIAARNIKWQNWNLVPGIRVEMRPGREYPITDTDIHVWNASGPGWQLVPGAGIIRANTRPCNWNNARMRCE